jgi:hypothetical protein
LNPAISPRSLIPTASTFPSGRATHERVPPARLEEWAATKPTPASSAQTAAKAAARLAFLPTRCTWPHHLTVGHGLEDALAGFAILRA